MKALVKFDRGREGMGIWDIPEPTPKKGELKVRVLVAGICGGDIHSMNDERDCVMPVALGHEYVGQVVEIGEDVEKFNIGDWVVTLPACYSCGECEFCRRGLVTLCPERKSIGTHVNGAMAEYLVVPEKYSFKVPPEIRDIEEIKKYALIEPMACVARGVYERIDVHPGDIAVVTGPGTIGLFAVQVLKSRGANVLVYGLPNDKKRLDLALELGAKMVFTDSEELKSALYKENPRGADITCDASGAVAAQDMCFQLVRTHGTHLQLGHFGDKKIPCHIDLIFDKEVNYVASNSTGMKTWDIALWLVNAGMVDLKPLMSLQLPLTEWEKGFDAMLNQEGYKILLLP
ncbi:MAG: alcohol dehydrogenase catalytic domain-containing protein [Smithella sp.]|nr:alcohol dehydrogenase catalytic domain-containing protein [Smithella sp.]